CTDDFDCETRTAPCSPCKDGFLVCGVHTCEGSVCVLHLPECPDPCEHGPCGADCTLACNGDACQSGYCDPTDQCVALMPSCGPSCQVDTDCAQPGGLCTMCPGGTTACPRAVCSGGHCMDEPPA